MILPRLAVGTVQPDSDATLAVWALLSGLRQAGLSLQSFRHQATFANWDGSLVISGREQRHLDSWLMTPDICRCLFQQNASDAELAIVEGPYDIGRSAAQTSGGSLDDLCRWLDLPRIVVVDLSRADPCRLRPLPFNPDGLILIGARSNHEMIEWETTLEAIWRAPIVAAIDDVSDLRSQVASLPRGARPSEQLCRQLGDRLQPRRHFPQLLEMAARPFETIPRSEFPLPNPTSVPLRVAIAFDEAFHCYYPDTLDCLEALGIELRLFSPLRSADLPANTDVVYLGCGQVESYADELAANHCLKQAIERFAASGGRIYAEGAGMAYLCRQVILDGGRRLPMAGALSAIATHNPHNEMPQPTIVHLRHATWMGEAYQELRGYLNPTWQMSSWGNVCDLALQSEHQGDIVAQRNVIASRLNINFAAQPRFLQRFPSPAVKRVLSLES